MNYLVCQKDPVKKLSLFPPCPQIASSTKPVAFGIPFGRCNLIDLFNAKMEFSVTVLNKSKETLNSTLCSILKETRVETVEYLDLNPSVSANKLNKNTHAKIVVDLAKFMQDNFKVCKTAAAKINELKSQMLVDQKTYIECQQKQLESVKTTVRTEIRSLSDIVRTNVSQAPSPTT
ncbi:hypothetical protein ACHWQZ_G000372, partial [Mnemiopsis leidyi]